MKAEVAAAPPQERDVPAWKLKLKAAKAERSPREPAPAPAANNPWGGVRLKKATGGGATGSLRRGFD